MNFTVTPFVPILWWAIGAGVALLFIISWASYERKEKKLNASWFLSVGIILSILGATLNPGIVSDVVETNLTDSSEDSPESDFDIYFVIDTTSSIAAEDWADGQTRLTGVKSDVKTIVDQYPGARYSLMTFDNVASTKVPMTNDSSAVLATIGSLQQEVTGNSKGSSVGEAAGLLTETLKQNATNDKKSLVFLFSDGEQTSSLPIESFSDASSYVASGLVLGYGTDEGGKMKQRIGYDQPSDDYIRDRDNQDAISKIDETNLQNIASDLGVEYLHRANGEPLDTALDSDDSAVGDIETSKYGVFGLYWVFALIAFVLMLIAFLQMVRGIQRTVTRRSAND